MITSFCMARRGNQPKKGVDQTSSKNKKKDPDVKGVADELPSYDHLNSNLKEGNKNSLAGDGRKKNKRLRNASKLHEPKVDDVDVGLSVLDNNISEECIKKLPSDSGMSHVRNHSSKSDYGASGSGVNGSYTHSRTAEVQFFHIVVLESLRHSTQFIIRTSRGWLERQKPVFTAVARNIYKFRDHVQLKIGQAYPVVLKWLFHLGNILLLVSMVWLDCAYRGMDSFLRMGTTSCFSIIWFSMLSVIAMIGMLKFLLVLAFAALIGYFLGFIISLLIVCIAGGVLLWFYGSFWTTSAVLVLAGLTFILSRERLALLITTVYSLYCAWSYVGWLGVLLGFNLSFISSDALVYFLKHNMDEQRSKPFEADGTQGEQSSFSGEAHSHQSDIGSGPSVDRSAGVASTSGTDSDITSEDEIIRLLNCTDHYSALGLSRYQQVDVSVLKRDYRKKAMLVHPDKNMGNEKAAEAFKKLQNAYEVLLDSLKRKAYDDELRKDELLNYFCRFQNASQKNGYARSEGNGEYPLGEARRIACKKCGSFHIWIQTKKSKLKARWCQDCEDYHQAKDGDGWVEQSSQPLLFGILRKVDVPVAYVCADGIVYDATEWYICQGMRCPANSHKPSFHVNTSVTKTNFGKNPSSSHRGGPGPSNMEENMTEDEFFEWLHNAMQSGMFDNFGGASPNESSQTHTKNTPKSSGANTSGVSSKRKKKGKKHT